MAESIAQNYFEKFTGPDAATVLSGIIHTNPKTFEDNWLDFKSGFTKPEDLESIWSKVLGAMANAGGGVVVWGIGARKHGKPPVDAAHSLELVPDVNYLTSRLIEICHFATDPPLAGIQVRPIPKAKGSNEGFVVCLVPEGRAKPYESLKAEKPFYLRMGDESRKPPLPILRQLFYPKRAIRLGIEMEPVTLTTGFNRVMTKDGQRLESICFRISVRNLGEYTVEHLLLRTQCDTAQSLMQWDYSRDKHKEIDIDGLNEITPLAIALNPKLSSTVKVIASFKDKAATKAPIFHLSVYGKDLSPLSAEIKYKGTLAKSECL